MAKYVDQTGLAYFWSKLKSAFVLKSDLTNTISNDSTKALTPKAVYDAGYLTLADLPKYDGSVTG